MSELKFRHNVMNMSSLNAFLSVKGGCSNNVRDVYFVRGLGETTGINEMLENIDRQMELEMSKNRLRYCRLSGLPQLKDTADAGYYSFVYEELINHNELKMKNISSNKWFEMALIKAINLVAEIYKEHKLTVSVSMGKNLAVKLLYWLDTCTYSLFDEWNEKSCIKVITDNVKKEQEYLFYLMLTYLGCDVYMVENRVDVDVADDLLNFTYALRIGDMGNTVITPYVKKGTQNTNQVKSAVNAVHSNNTVKTKSKIEEANKEPGLVRDFEELAQLASSVVLIAVHGSAGDIVGTGSGIMIGRNGFILTNNHVASGGKFYSVRIEDDEEVYTTTEVIKYNSITDLAVIRINRVLNPLPIYDGRKPLVRGQKVVAIGSPLGLFNSVSDGIISGFRKINDVEMLQFTAPISHGSSGGAVLNMCGEVIGISTAGLDGGQNINLAVGYENISVFIKGFTT